MADRAMCYCPRCRDLGSPQVELMRDNHVYTCMFGHAIHGYDSLMSLHPELIKLVSMEKPGPGDVKTEFWVDAKVLEKFNQMYPNQRHATVNSILSLFTTGDIVIIDGIQAKELKKSGIKNGAEMLAAVQAAKSIEAENDDLKSKLDFISQMFSKTGMESPV